MPSYEQIKIHIAAGMTVAEIAAQYGTTESEIQSMLDWGDEQAAIAVLSDYWDENVVENVIKPMMDGNQAEMVVGLNKMAGELS